ncbi:DUF5753 domain-containing protein [Micromonospora phaseoli]|nr:DUF5753 domain-containing protein [Micromonospora phaseoli]
MYDEVIPRWFQLYVGLESAANRIRSYEQSLIPGLLQTPEYTAEVARCRPGITDDEVAKLVELRLERQRILTRRRPTAPMLDEGLLHRSLPGMSRQIAKLIEAGEAPNVSVRIAPLNGKLNRAAVAGSFVILDFPVKGARSAEPTTVYNESLSGALYLDRLDEVRAYAEVWNQLSAAALSSEESRTLLRRIMERHHD